MRRKNLGNRIVKKAITWAMVVMMSFSGAMSGFTSMTVYAEETQDFTDAEKTDNSIYNYVDKQVLSDKEFVDSSTDEYHNNEANEKKVEETSQDVKDMTAAAEDAKKAAEGAASSLSELNTAVDTAVGQKEVVAGAVDSANLKENVQAATNAASGA